MKGSSQEIYFPQQHKVKAENITLNSSIFLISNLS